MREKVIVVSPKGFVPDFIYQGGAIVKQADNPPLPELFYNYGHLADHSDSQDGDYDRIIVTTRRLARGQVLICEPTKDTLKVNDARYGNKRITYILTYDAGNYPTERAETLARSYRGLLTTRKNVRRYCDLLKTNPRFTQIGLSWYYVRY